MKNILNLVIGLIFFLLIATPVNAQNIAGQSAKMLKIEANNYDTLRLTKKRLALTKVLTQRNSPLLESVNSFLLTCSTYELDCYLLPSITGLESSFGVYTHPGSYNPFGWGGGYIMFNNWDQAINTVGKGLRKNYIDKGAASVDEIAPIYAESKTWAPRVKIFMAAFEEEEAKIDAIIGENVVQL
ncbi:hypothetical protein A2767_04885 [Candidatus Roizmanbacteria bacterium RIFCSPHIGHO2_01_FULL_35_10]|uniref:Mannosyl-glycoprotein endo-beta-N-acetylglucosamidase-like domain-containing protein n=1 Tax=Candidatus Roizmanbacteria bacterium RIFCSPLOWO2_01_FULL_35_13 TaxID=1802055 RepID=A0A1F7I764_9BACT|nr:MAG: hypothetical protein A2767_04885 [Candidatus Roizmanbacteria bacterium RIFCSPHIGHO2_01_FULL_35_10]OGK39205.1 MAG: hypothetical protein A3A74_07630 [Candidatus Roizmanbacteria bacterium RIFCSPLOWO2_01_FULL_35_13]